MHDPPPSQMYFRESLRLVPLKKKSLQEQTPEVDGGWLVVYTKNEGVFIVQ